MFVTVSITAIEIDFSIIRFQFYGLIKVLECSVKFTFFSKAAIVIGFDIIRVEVYRLAVVLDCLIKVAFVFIIPVSQAAIMINFGLCCINRYNLLVERLQKDRLLCRLGMSFPSKNHPFIQGTCHAQDSLFLDFRQGISTASPASRDGLSDPELGGLRCGTQATAGNRG